ncbi:eye-specific diacylglycerol kinase isoform X2 [Orussus abietinus]|uniref:eye-specific diacylglycerol kinase isoform X2 n=1 Tax=Orussus abietinus TaxID=222816 RepID=UPI0006261C30|nr:eye-specific diacylglycerol kinase isoform X2 [Orussus abietinus]
MQRLRSTFKRSRTPTGAEMKSQSSLEVPKQVRSASFDEIQLEAKRRDETGPGARAPEPRASSSSSSSCSPARSHRDAGATRRLTTLRVPQLQGQQRSRSFDVSERRLPRGSPGSPGSPGPLGALGGPGGTGGLSGAPTIQLSGCYHCACVEEYRGLHESRGEDSPSGSEEDGDSRGAGGGEVEAEAGTSEEDGDSSRDRSPEIRVTLTPSGENTVLALDEASSGGAEDEAEASSRHRPRRRSVSSPKLARQEALDFLQSFGPRDDDDEEEEEAEAEEDDDEEELERRRNGLVVRDIFLTVPDPKRDRAASVDSCFDGNKGDKADRQDSLAVPQQSTRSKSVDIVLPTEAQTRYTALLPTNGSRSLRGGREEGGPSGTPREPRSTPDWGPGAINGEHFWVPTAASGDFCYVNDCSKHGPRMKCSACRVVAHALCAVNLKFACKTSFRDVGVRQYREQTSTHHHWVHRRSQKGKCTNCGKSFQSKLSFGSKEIVAVSCSWCKAAYHNKESCFNVERIGENCELGAHASIVVPPSWIVKLPRKGSFKSSLRKSPRRKGTSKKAKEKEKEDKEKENNEKEQDRLWVIKPIPTATVTPVLVFINPKSGGNQGAKLLQKFQWLLNPRQVFDLTQGGPRMGLELFKKVPNLRVLACGGDGTVGWVLSVLDQIGVSPSPAVGVLPLGTGNDLARALGWGGGYTDEPIGKILTNIGDSETTLLDRWQLVVERNQDAPSDDDAGKGKENLPLNVVNNYFSLGVDAHIALEFHEAREAHPEKFNSRLRNKMFYGQMGGKDLVRRKWKDLSEFVTLQCDDKDLTPKLKEHRVHAIVFLNIASYGGGTHPWGATSGTKEPTTEDGLIEVVGLTTYQLPLLQAGGHGTCIAQCSKAKLVTTRTIPMQVDGEACRLLPSVITLSLLNQATMLAKRRSTGKPYRDVGAKLERLKLPVMRIRMSDYEAYHSDKERLKSAAVSWTAEPLDLDAATDLESLRQILAKDHPMDSCCFLDSCTAERFFRIDRAQEQLHYVTDVAVEAVYVLEETSSGPTSADADAASDRRDAQSTRDERSRLASAPTLKLKSDRDPEVGSRPRQEPTELKAEEVPAKVQEEPKPPQPEPPLKDEMPEEPPRQSSSKPISAVSEVQPQHRHSTTFISPRDRLFGLSSEVHAFSHGLLERTSDGILKAAKVGDLQALKDLHQRGYSLLSIDATGQTALHFAARHGHKDVVRYLIACSPPTILNMVDNDKGQTALHKAAQQKRRSICCMLVAGGATLTVRDRHGNTPRQLALMAEDRDLAAYLYSQEQFQLVTEEGGGVL